MGRLTTIRGVGLFPTTPDFSLTGTTSVLKREAGSPQPRSLTRAPYDD